MRLTCLVFLYLMKDLRGHETEIAKSGTINNIRRGVKTSSSQPDHENPFNIQKLRGKVEAVPVAAQKTCYPRQQVVENGILYISQDLEYKLVCGEDYSTPLGSLSNWRCTSDKVTGQGMSEEEGYPALYCVEFELPKYIYAEYHFVSHSYSPSFCDEAEMHQQLFDSKQKFSSHGFTFQNVPAKIRCSLKWFKNGSLSKVY